ncbi:MAG: sodium:proton exchanger, partial [Lentisphaerae bacterium]|nr:sodium:proton exchanger [Lentisphaerota bacterium]
MPSKMLMLAIQIGIILFAARLSGMLAERIKIPSVLGELMAGIAIGPYAFGSMNLGGIFSSGLFPAPGAGVTFPVTPELYGFCTVASILLLFLSGVETDLKLFVRYSLAGSLVGIGGVV